MTAGDRISAWRSATEVAPCRVCAAKDNGISNVSGWTIHWIDASDLNTVSGSFHIYVHIYIY